YLLENAGWQSQQTYPAVNNILNIAAPQAEPGTLLLQTKDAGDLQVTRWENGRLTYPKPWPPSESSSADRKILALGMVGPTVWWAQRVGKDVDLYHWGPKEKSPSRIRFTGVGSKVENVQWLGGERILLKNKHSRTAKLAVNENGKTTISEPTHLKNLNLNELVLYWINGKIQPARRTEGVLQWLGDDLHSVDQVMLPRGQKLIDYVATGEGQGWALQEEGKRIHRMKADKTDVVRVTESIKLPGGGSLIDEPVLGLILVGNGQIIKLGEGHAIELKLKDSLDHRNGQPSGRKNASIHRVGAADLTGNRSDELILMDDLRHQMTILKTTDGGLKPHSSWPIFDDEKYPYGDEQSSPVVSEPRSVLPLDLDGDQQQDLALLCHDRVIIYLANEKP
ncbi:MAG: hypothetical protein N2C12_11265, partial [Planctomycetales bacterium]